MRKLSVCNAEPATYDLQDTQFYGGGCKTVFEVIEIRLFDTVRDTAHNVDQANSLVLKGYKDRYAIKRIKPQ